MDKLKREDIRIISQHSNWSEQGIRKRLISDVYPGTGAWLQFTRILCLALGTGFAVAGILFFFAYNWADLHKFVKIGLIEGLIVVLVICTILLKAPVLIRQLLLTAASLLTGVLFAVFGQVYQTGANAYDFFLGWTAMIVLWVLAANFAPLWLIFLVLVQTTFLLFTQQVAIGWSAMEVYGLLFVFNAGVLALLRSLPATVRENSAPRWLADVVALAAVTFATVAMIYGIYEPGLHLFPLLCLLCIALYLLAVRQGMREKRGFYLSITGFSVVIVFSALLAKLIDDTSVLFLIALFIVVSITLLVLGLIRLQKKWSHEK